MWSTASERAEGSSRRSTAVFIITERILHLPMSDCVAHGALSVRLSSVCYRTSMRSCMVYLVLWAQSLNAENTHDTGSLASQKSKRRRTEEAFFVAQQTKRFLSNLHIFRMWFRDEVCVSVNVLSNIAANLEQRLLSSTQTVPTMR